VRALRFPVPALIVLIVFVTALRAEESALFHTVPVDLTVDVLKVGSAGTETLATDRARVFVGKGALLDREVTLRGKNSRNLRVTERLRVRAELRTVGVVESGLTLTLKSKVRVLAVAGGGRLPHEEIRRSETLEISRGASQLVTVYESPDLGDKVTLNVKWDLVQERGDADDDSVSLELSARVYEMGGSGETLLADNRLVAVVGHGASTTFDRVVPLRDGKGAKRVRQDRMEITLTPRFLLGRNLSVALEVGGEVVTLTPEARYSHSLAHQGNYLLSPGLPESIQLEVVSESEETEGWSRIRFRLEVSGSF